MKQKYIGGCQCGKVRYEVSLELGEVISCNCSRCGRWGSLLAFVPASDFNLISGDDAMSEYRFNRKAIRHLFCATCGIQSFGRGKRPDGTEMAAINVRCLEGVDADTLTIKKFDGKSL